MPIICGVDPGASPTLAFLNTDGMTLSFAEGAEVAGKTPQGKVRPIPELLKDALLEHSPSLTVIENSRGLPGDRAVSGQTLVACVHGVWFLAIGMGLRVSRVEPTVWKRGMGLLRSDKDASRRVACEEFPGQAGLFARKGDHNRAEAALLALWAHRKMAA